jgi:hypothetical protein
MSQSPAPEESPSKEHSQTPRSTAARDTVCRLQALYHQALMGYTDEVSTPTNVPTADWPFEKHRRAREPLERDIRQLQRKLRWLIPDAPAECFVEPLAPQSRLVIEPDNTHVLFIGPFWDDAALMRGCVALDALLARMDAAAPDHGTGDGPQAPGAAGTTGPPDEAVLDALRKAIADTPDGSHAAGKTIIATAHVDEQAGWAGLHTLRERGEYSGHQRARSTRRR